MIDNDRVGMEKFHMLSLLVV